MRPSPPQERTRPSVPRLSRPMPLSPRPTSGSTHAPRRCLRMRARRGLPADAPAPGQVLADADISVPFWEMSGIVVRVAALGADATITAAYVRERLRSASLEATAAFAALGEVSGTIERSVALAARRRITAVSRRDHLRQAALDAEAAAAAVASSGTSGPSPPATRRYPVSSSALRPSTRRPRSARYPCGSTYDRRPRQPRRHGGRCQGRTGAFRSRSAPQQGSRPAREFYSTAVPCCRARRYSRHHDRLPT